MVKNGKSSKISWLYSEWHTGYDSTAIPFPVEKAIKYWNNKGLVLALNCGIISFAGLSLLTVIKSQWSKKISKYQ